MATYTEQQRIKLIDTICEEITKGRPLRTVTEDEGMPTNKTFLSWINNNKERLQQYAHACEDRAEGIFEEMFDIADDGTNDFVKKGMLAVDHCHNKGEVRGLLCYSCNIALGLFKDDINKLKSAISYLQENSH